VATTKTTTRKTRTTKAKPQGKTLHAISHGIRFECVYDGERYYVGDKSFASLSDAGLYVREK
jgi:hypothetical protein